MIILIVTFLAFILEYVVNGFFHGTILNGLIIFSSLVLLEPYFKKNKDMFFVFCFFVGIFYDFVYTGTYFMNAGMFLIVGVLVSYFNGITPNNFVVSILELIVMSFSVLFRSIYSSILINLIYGILLYFILYLVSKRFNIKRIN